MDVLNAVESVQSSLRVLLEKQNGGQSHQSDLKTLQVRVMSLYLLHCLYSYLPIQQNPFLCLFVDIYNVASQDERLKSERFVTSVILNGKGEELAPKTPSELVALAQKVESRPVNLGLLEEYLPEVCVEDQVQVGLGWDSQWQRDHKKRVWGTFMMGCQNGDDQHHQDYRRSPCLSNGLANSQNTFNTTAAAMASATPVVVVTAAATGLVNEDHDSDDELEEWEIEAERRFQDSDVDDAPSLSSPAKSSKYNSDSNDSINGSSNGMLKTIPAKPKRELIVKPVVVREKKTRSNSNSSSSSRSSSGSNSAMEKTAAAPAIQARDQDQVKRRRKMWPRK